MIHALLDDSPVPQGGRRVLILIDYFLSLPTVTSQSFAHPLARALRLMPQSDWSAEDLDKIRRRQGDNWELKDALVGITAAAGGVPREELFGVLRQGNTRMLSSVSDVSSIPEDVAQKQIAALSESVRREVKEAEGEPFIAKTAEPLPCSISGIPTWPTGPQYTTCSLSGA